MGMLYSKTTNQFYSDTLTYTNLPVDAVPISETLHVQVLQDQSSGKTLKADDSGLPTTVQTITTNAQQVDNVKIQAQVALDNANTTLLQAIQDVILGNAQLTDPQIVSAATYRQGLLSVISDNSGKVLSLPAQPAYVASSVATATPLQAQGSLNG